MLSILSVILLCGFQKCEEAPDAWDCTFILKVPIQDSYNYCVNMDTGADKEVSVQDMHKWFTTDRASKEKIRQFYLDKCNN